MALFQHNRFKNTPGYPEHAIYRYSRDKDKIDHAKDVAAIQRMFYVRRYKYFECGTMEDYNYWLAGFGMSHNEWEEFKMTKDR